MGYIRAIERRLRRRLETFTAKKQKDESGVALFMVIAAITVLSIIVTEFTYIAQVNQKVAYDGLDELKAHYLAKTGFKISLLRLKAYQKVKGMVSGMAGNAGAAVPKQLIESIWSFPFIYPIPTEIPGLLPSEIDKIKKFQEESGLQGQFTAVIQSESSKYNLNSVLPAFAAPTPSPSPTSSPPPQSGQGGSGSDDKDGDGDGDENKLTPETARKALGDYLAEILKNEFDKNPDLETDYRDLVLQDLLNSIVTWADRTADRGMGNRDLIPSKQAPFYSLSELHMIEPMDDQLYDILAPYFTVSPTPGLNVNTIKPMTLRAFLPDSTDEEIKDFFEFRDATDIDNSFKSADDFFKYLETGFSRFRGDPEEVARFKEELQKRGVQVVVDEKSFKITVQAKSNKVTKLLEAWVVFTDEKKSNPPGQGTSDSGSQAQPPQNPPSNANEKAPETGLKVIFMRLI